MHAITVIGGGLAGSEAAWQIAQSGLAVCLYEMRPVRPTEAHHTDSFAELVCSNSLRSAALTTAIGLLKQEMRHLGWFFMDWTPCLKWLPGRLCAPASASGPGPVFSPTTCP